MPLIAVCAFLAFSLGCVPRLCAFICFTSATFALRFVLFGCVTFVWAFFARSFLASWRSGLRRRGYSLVLRARIRSIAVLSVGPQQNVAIAFQRHGLRRSDGSTAALQLIGLRARTIGNIAVLSVGSQQHLPARVCLAGCARGNGTQHSVATPRYVRLSLRRWHMRLCRCSHRVRPAPLGLQV